MLLEIACFNITSAIAAAQTGANRIELCQNPQEGGTTPSYGTIRQALQQISIPVFPIIRPRGGDFLYNEDEFSAMLYDVQLCKEMGCKGVVLGLLNKDGSVEVAKTAELVHAAGNMEITFHRAFDRAANPLQALEDVISTGCRRLLTSGQTETASQGQELIKQLVQQADGRIIILPGSGVRSGNIIELKKITGALEFHSSARMQVASGMEYTATGIKEDMSMTGVNVEEIALMQLLLSKEVVS